MDKTTKRKLNRDRNLAMNVAMVALHAEGRVRRGADMGEVSEAIRLLQKLPPFETKASRWDTIFEFAWSRRLLAQGVGGKLVGVQKIPEAGVKKPKKEKKPKRASYETFKAFYLTREWREVRYEALKIHGAC